MKRPTLVVMFPDVVFKYNSKKKATDVFFNTPQSVPAVLAIPTFGGYKCTSFNNKHKFLSSTKCVIEWVKALHMITDKP